MSPVKEPKSVVEESSENIQNNFPHDLFNFKVFGDKLINEEFEDVIDYRNRETVDNAESQGEGNGHSTIDVKANSEDSAKGNKIKANNANNMAMKRPKAIDTSNM